MNKLFPFLLSAISFRVLVGIAVKHDMWPWIALYWLVLTAKNLHDLMEV